MSFDIDISVGSLSILGIQDEDGLPAEMSMSNDIDSYTKADPGRIHDVNAALGEGSEFHKNNGYYLDPVSPNLPTLPDGWQNRMTSMNRGNVTLWFLDPDDAAMSKYARNPMTCAGFEPASSAVSFRCRRSSTGSLRRPFWMAMRNRGSENNWMRPRPGSRSSKGRATSRSTHPRFERDRGKQTSLFSSEPIKCLWLSRRP